MGTILVFLDKNGTEYHKKYKGIDLPHKSVSCGREISLCLDGGERPELCTTFRITKFEGEVNNPDFGIVDVITLQNEEYVYESED